MTEQRDSRFPEADLSQLSLGQLEVLEQRLSKALQTNRRMVRGLTPRPDEETGRIITSDHQESLDATYLELIEQLTTRLSLVRQRISETRAGRLPAKLCYNRLSHLIFLS